MKKKKKPRAMLIPFLFFLFSLLLSCMYFGSYVLWMFFFFLCFILLTDLCSFLLINKKLEVKQSISTNLTECYSVVLLNLEFKNKCSIIISYKENNDIVYKFINQTSYSIPITQKKIGIQQIGLDYVFRKSIFGLFLLKKKVIAENPDQLKCFVVPILKNLKCDNSHFKDILASSNTSNYNSPYDDFAGNKPYTPGDPLRLINYKKSASVKKTLVKDYKQEKSSVMYNIFIDEFNIDCLETVAEAILSINKFYESNGGNVLFLYFYDGYEGKYDEDTCVKLPSDIAKYNPKPDVKLNFFDIKTNTLPTVVIFSKHLKSFDLSLINNLPKSSMIFLIGEAIKNKDILISSNLKNIIVADETMLSEINDEDEFKK